MMAEGESIAPPTPFAPDLFPSGNDKEDFEMTKTEFEQFKEALKQKKFRDLLSEYATEIRDPKNRAIYQSEIRQLEKEKGNVVHFINPVPEYVIKTSVNGEKKGFINICSNPMIRAPSFQNAMQGNRAGTMWSIPYAQSPPREDFDKAGTQCFVYDIIFSPTIFQLAKNNSQMKEKLEQTAFEAIESGFNVTLDRNNMKKPKLKYKGMNTETMIKYKTGDNPPNIIDPSQIEKELPPQAEDEISRKQLKGSKTTENPSLGSNLAKDNPPEKRVIKEEEMTVPRYTLKYRSHVNLQDYSIGGLREGSNVKAIPEEIIIVVDLPMLREASGIDADVSDDGWNFELTSTQRANYHLKMKLPFKVHHDKAKASFDVDNRKLTICLQTVQKIASKNDHHDHETIFSMSPEEGFLKENMENLPVCSPAKRQDSTESDNSIGSVKWINGDVVVKSILKRSGSLESARSRSMSESWIDDMSPPNSGKEDFMSLEYLNEVEEDGTESGNGESKSVRFSDSIQHQLYRSNSSILGQRKKNQRKSKNKRNKQRERFNSEGSVSSMDEDFSFISQIETFET